MKTLRIFSAGWGVQSTAVLVLQGEGKLANPYDYFVFANVGEDSENPATLEYYKNVIKPYATAHDIKLVEVQKTRKGEPDTVYSTALRDSRSIGIPIVFPGKGFGNRSCTFDFKVAPVMKWVKAQGAPQVIMGIGYTIDEQHRKARKPEGWHEYTTTRDKKTGKITYTNRRIGFSQKYEYPLIDMGMGRTQAAMVVINAGLPAPPKSACWFCPFSGRSVWIDRKRKDPEAFSRAVQFEHDINMKYQRITTGNAKASPFVCIHRDGIKLEDVPDQLGLWDSYMDMDSGCDDVCGV